MIGRLLKYLYPSHERRGDSSRLAHMRPTRKVVMRQDQKGVALIIVLMMTASLAFIALGVTERMGRSIDRTTASIGRAALHWRAVSLEPIAAVAIEQALGAPRGQAAPPLTPLNPLFLRAITVPLPDGSAEAAFVDATRCFNLNALDPSPPDTTSDNDDDQQTGGQSASSGQASQAAAADGDAADSEGDDGERQGDGKPITPNAEFVALGVALGVPAGEAERIAAVIIDWIDADAAPGFGGAEDNFYTGLPTPYRTGGGPLADISELRAMDGINREIYLQLRPFLCARPTARPTTINVNMLEARHAPLITAMTGGRVSVNEAQDVIERRPPGGWENLEDFWAQPPMAALKGPNTLKQSRTALTSRYIAVQAKLSINEIDMTETLVFRMSARGTAAQLISREFGARS